MKTNFQIKDKSNIIREFMVLYYIISHRLLWLNIKNISAQFNKEKKKNGIKLEIEKKILKIDI